MKRSDLVEVLASKQPHFSNNDVDAAIKVMIESMTEAMASGRRVEIRGFGSFSLNKRNARIGRNPKTGEPVSVGERHVPHFKPGKEMKETVNAGAGNR